MPNRTRTVARPTTPADLQAAVNSLWPGVMKFADDPSFVIERLPSGILALDVRLRGGFARGRHHEIFGTNNVGKTAITFRTIAKAQEAGLHCSFIDVEGTFDPNFAESQGVDLSRLALTDQHLLEQGHRVIDYLEAQLRSEVYDVVVLDSIASLLPKAEMEASMEDPSMGTEQARLMSKALRKLTAANKRTVLMYINQTREAVGGSAFAKKTITSGGKAMAFYAGTRLELVRIEMIKRNSAKQTASSGVIKKASQVAGHRILLRVEKDKTGSANNGSETSLVFDYKLGTFDHYEDLVYLGREFGLIKKSGSNWWLADYPEDKVNGRPKMKTYLRRNPAIAEELQEAIEELAYSGADTELEADEDEE